MRIASHASTVDYRYQPLPFSVYGMVYPMTYICPSNKAIGQEPVLLDIPPEINIATVRIELTFEAHTHAFYMAGTPRFSGIVGWGSVNSSIPF